MSDTVVLDGAVSLNTVLDGVVGTVLQIETETGIESIVFNDDYTLTFNMTNGNTYTTGSIRGAQGEQGEQGEKGDTGDTYTLTEADMETIASLVSIPVATTSTDGLMSAEDKTNLDTVVADYSSALTALGVIE